MVQAAAETTTGQRRQGPHKLGAQNDKQPVRDGLVWGLGEETAGRSAETGSRASSAGKKAALSFLPSTAARGSPTATNLALG